MNRLLTNSPLCERLASNPPAWWRDLVEDEDVAIQIRKDNHIDIYYNGGSIIRKLTFDGKSFKGETHFKYIPLESRGHDDVSYVPYVFEKDSLHFGNVDIMRLDRFDKKSLRRIKQLIANYYPSGSEKAIQYSFIKNDPHFIDSEFEYSFNNGNEDRTIRIDLVRMDTRMKKIVFVEVKTIGDRRLFNNEIIKQLNDYQDFITQCKLELLVYYKNVFQIKKKLGILPDGLTRENVDAYGIIDRPLLLFGDCGQGWIDKNASSLDEKIGSHALGCYYFGKPAYHCDIIPKSKKNRHIFIRI